MSLDELIKAFLDQTGYMENDKILAIVAYGSRVRKTNKKTSDLDLLIIANSPKNYKASMTIQGILIDYNIFSVHTLFEVAYDKKIANNAYFESILKNCLLIKNQHSTIEQLESYLDELKEVKSPKRKLSKKWQAQIKEAYETFISQKNLASYYYLLELFRTSYNYLKNYSYISMIKVYDVFKNRDFYEEAYSIQIPGERFASLFLSGIEAFDFTTQLNIVHSFFTILGLTLNEDYYYQKDSFTAVSADEQKRKLVILHNKCLAVVDFLKNNHPYALYSYYVTLHQMQDFYIQIYGHENEIIKDALHASVSQTNQEKIVILNQIFSLFDKDYHFDYGNYMLKLNL